MNHLRYIPCHSERYSTDCFINRYPISFGLIQNYLHIIERLMEIISIDSNIEYNTINKKHNLFWDIRIQNSYHLFEILFGSFSIEIHNINTVKKNKFIDIICNKIMNYINSSIKVGNIELSFNCNLPIYKNIGKILI